MKKSTLLLLAFITLPFFVGCNQDEIDALQARLIAAEAKIAEDENRSVSALQALEEGKCTISESNGDSAELVCGDGTSFTITNGADGVDGEDGADGVDGIDGIDGIDGASCDVAQVEGQGALVTCGENMVMIYNGQDGADGEDGSDGENGSNGMDGEDGADGQNGQDGVSSVIEIIDPCGDQGRFDEVLLRLHDGSLLAHYASGSRQFLTFIGPGNYITTDGLGCSFTVDNDMNVSWATTTGGGGEE